MLLFLSFVIIVGWIIVIFSATLMVALIAILVHDAWVGYNRDNKAEKRHQASLRKVHVHEMMAKEAVRRQKERDANEGFFEESYIRGFDPNGAIYHRPKVVPTAMALEYYRQMEELINTQQFNVVEEIQNNLSNPKD